MNFTTWQDCIEIGLYSVFLSVRKADFKLDVYFDYIPRKIYMGPLVCGNYPPMNIPQMVKMNSKPTPRPFGQICTQPTASIKD